MTRSLTWLLALALLLFAAWLRLRHLGYTEIWEDQAITLNMALEWVHGGALPLASMKSSFGVFNPPLIEYLYALPLFFKPDILGVAWLTALVNLAGVLVAGLATARVFGERVGWWATLLFAVNPWAVYYGRLIWMQSFVPGFSSLLYACVLLYFTVDARPIYLVLAALCLSATVQVHLTAAVLGLPLLLIGLCFLRRLKFWPTAAGLALALASFAPFVLFQFRSGFADWPALRAGLSQPSQVNLAPVLILLDLLQSKGIYSTLGSAGDLWRSLDLGGLHADALIALLFGVAVLAAIISTASELRAIRRPGQLPPRAAGQLILLIWLILPLVVFIRHTQYLQNYYFLYLFPVPFVLLALFADQIYRWLAHVFERWRWAAAAAFLPLALISFQQARLNVIGQNLLVAGASGRQRILDVRRAIASANQLLAERPDCQLVVMSEGAEYESSRFALLREFVSPARVRFAQAGAGYLLPAPCAVYFSVTPDFPYGDAQAWLEENARSLPERTIRTPEQTWAFYDLPASDRAAALAHWHGRRPGPPQGEWENGLQLKSLTIQGEQEAGATLTLWSTWEVTRAVPPEPIHFGHYLLVDAGTLRNRVVAQVDGPGMDSTQWRLGDVFQTAFPLALPADLAPGTYTLAVALYRYPQIENLRLRDDVESVLRLGTLSIAARQALPA